MSGLYTAAQYQAIHDQQIALEREMDELAADGKGEGHPEHVALYRRWEALQLEADQ